MKARHAAVIRLGIAAARIYITPNWRDVRWHERALLQTAWQRETVNIVFRNAYPQ